MVDIVEDYVILMLDFWGCVNIWNYGVECNMGYVSNEIIG